MTRQSVISAIFLTILTIVASDALLAQGRTASISGNIMDESGAVLPGVTVTVTNLDTGISRSLVTDDTGRYRAPELELGNYGVKAELAGFQTTIRSGIELTVGRSAVVDIFLKVGEVSEEITVSGEAALVETREATMSGLVTAQAIADLPLNGRNMVQLTLLEGGVSNNVRALAFNTAVTTGFLTQRSLRCPRA